MSSKDEGAVRFAINGLFTRKRLPKPREGKTVEYAVGILAAALANGSVGGEVSEATHGDDAEAAKISGDLADAARKAHVALSSFQGIVRRHAVSDGAQSTVRAILGAMGQADAPRSRQAEWHAAVEAIPLLLARLAELEAGATTSHAQIRSGRQNVGKPVQRNQMRELALVWCDLVGAKPVARKTQETPFGNFVTTALGITGDATRTVNVAINGVTDADVQSAIESGYTRPF